ncbi:MAG: site-2 protease family protein [Coriobacteriia bacterium]|nr:site-2 protease family protein [Coriobacteriia bacterium]MCL2749869.1 site-2 protease family protein [Coriobacteriia bacterium]
MAPTIFGYSALPFIMLLCFVPAIVVHEVAHGFVAWKLGDPTAKDRGRLSLNPIRHIDPFGTVILPIALAIYGGPVFGYAKPVPYNPTYFKDIRKGELLTGMAGPASNLIMSIIGALITNVLLLVGTFSAEVTMWIFYGGYYFVFINLVLMFFNLLPIPPLDGSSIIAIFLSDSALRKYYNVQRYALPILLLLLFVIPWASSSLFGVQFNPIGIYISATAGNLTELFFSPILGG